MSELPARLKTMRALRGLTQRQLAKKMNVSPSTIALYETGDRNPDPQMLKRLADCLDCSVDYLLGRTVLDGSKKLDGTHKLNGEKPTKGVETEAAHRTDDPAPPQARKKEYSYEEYVLSAPSLDKAAIRINELYESYIINKEYALNLHRLAYEKYGLPPAPGSEPAAHHVSGKPATGVFDDDKK